VTPAELAIKICRQNGHDFVGLEGSGAFKNTFHTRSGGTSIALKLYNQKGMAERSHREIAAMKKCDHPAIAKFISLGSISDGADKYVYLLEEHLSGGTLKTRVGKLNAPDIARLALTLSTALDHIAERNLVHRDLKPENIMFRDSGLDSPVIVDFGLVRDLSASSLTATWAMRGPGTAFYAAPEQLNNEKSMVDWRTDQFGLGIALAFALFQTHPFARSGDSVGETVERVLNWEEPSPTFFGLCRSTNLEPLSRMVRPYAVDRYRTARDLIAAWEGTAKT